MVSERINFIYKRVMSRLNRYATAIRNPVLFLNDCKERNNQRLKLIELFENSKMEEGKDLTCLIFSKDRAIQLNALISSYKDSIRNAPKIYVTYGGSTERHLEAYKAVFEKHQDVVEKFDERSDSQFRESFLKLLNSVKTSKVFFLVDDNIFTRDFDIHKLSQYPSNEFVPSLRMHEALDWCFNRYRPQKVPMEIKSEQINGEHFSWLYGQGDGDWGYPLSLDGHIFSTNEMKMLMNEIAFSSPNSLELGMQILNPLFYKRKGVCSKVPVMVNVPCNKIQSENDNPFTQRYHQDELLEMWEDGLEINFLELKEFVNSSAHDDVEFSFRKR